MGFKSSQLNVEVASLSPRQRAMLELHLRKNLTASTQIEVQRRSRASNCFPLSLIQQRLWFIDQLYGGNAADNLSIGVRLTGRLDEAALEKSLNEIVRRHESLRTTFALINDQPVQVINQFQRLKLPVVDLSELPERSRETQATDLSKTLACRPFDLNIGPLLRSCALRLSEQVQIILLTIHHIVSDGWSMGVLAREITSLYEAFSNGHAPALPELPIQYADYAIWQQEWLQGKVLEEQLVYWKQRLSGTLPVMELPTDRPRPKIQTYHGALRSFHLSSDLASALKGLGAEQGATLFMTLLAAFKVLLRFYTKQDDVIVGTDISNRNRVEFECLIGFFVNQLALRTDMSGDPTFRSLLERVRNTCIEAYNYQDVPFDKLVEVLKPRRDPSRNPIFQVVFILHSQNVPSLPPSAQFARESLAPTMIGVEIDTQTAPFDLTLHMVDQADRLSGIFKYNTDLFDADRITRMSEHFKTIVSCVAESPDLTITELEDRLLEAEKQRQNNREAALKESRLQKFEKIRMKAGRQIEKGKTFNG